MMNARRSLLGWALATATLPAAARVPFWGDRDSRPAGTEPAALGAGQWVWQAELSSQGPVLVVVDLDRQFGWAWRNGVLVGYTSVSTGKKGFETPTGVFHTLQKDRDHRSSTYHNAPMPFTQRLTWGGVALHAGGLPGYPSSHGCVHLPSGFAQRLFEVSPLGMTVVVARGESAPFDVAQPLPIAAIDPRTGSVAQQPRLSEGEPWRWRPGAAPAGPLAIVLSRSDSRVVVLRSGLEIGRARVRIDDPTTSFGTHAFIAHAPSADGPSSATPDMRWVGVAVPGHAEDAGRALTPQDFERVQLPAGFLAALRPAIQPGTTLVVVDAPILPTTTGRRLTVVTNRPAET